MEKDEELLKEFRISAVDLLTEIRQALKGYFNVTSVINRRKLFMKFCNGQRFIISVEER